MTQVVQTVDRPTVVFEARSLVTGAVALVLTAPIPICDNPSRMELAESAGWRYVDTWLDGPRLVRRG